MSVKAYSPHPKKPDAFFMQTPKQYAFLMPNLLNQPIFLQFCCIKITKMVNLYALEAPMITISNAYILTPNARKAILEDLSARIQELKYARSNAVTSDLLQGIDAEIKDLMRQQCYYSDFRAGVGQISTPIESGNCERP